jgi:hypothetical protein
MYLSFRRRKTTISELKFGDSEFNDWDLLIQNIKKKFGNRSGH